MKKIKVFVSSPRDVQYERTLAVDLFKQLNEEFGGWVEIEPFFWEDGVLKLHINPQAQTPLTSEYDVVVCLLWTRLGSMLHPHSFRRSDSNTPYKSGTEFEIEIALENYERNGKPITYLFRRTEEPTIKPSDPNYEKFGSDFRAMECYYAELLGRKYLERSGNLYEKPGEFVKKLNRAMRDYLNTVVGIELSGTSRRRTGQPRVNPFRGLRSFDYGDAAFFRGRLSATLEVIEALKVQADKKCPFLMIFGSSGLGKSSLVRAGVLPWLLKPGVVEKIRFWRYVALIPSHDKDGDLFRLLAEALLHRAAALQGPVYSAVEMEPKPPDRGLPGVGVGASSELWALPEIGEDYDADGARLDVATLATLLREKPNEAQNRIGKALQRIGKNIGAKEASEETLLGRVVIFIDQFEEIFSNLEREQFLATIEVLARSGWAWVIATARSDFFSKCEDWPTLRRLKQGTGTYHLAPPTEEELGEMIRRPAAIVDMQFEWNSQGRRLDDTLIHAAHGNPYALPMLEFTLSQLYEKTDPEERIIRLRTYDDIGGLHGALAIHAEASFTAVFPKLVPTASHDRGVSPDDTQMPEQKYGPEAMRCFGSVMRQLLKVGIGEGEKPVRKSSSKTTLETTPKQTSLTNRLIADRLLVVTADMDGSNVSVTLVHEALLSCWPTLRNWIENHRQDLKILERLTADAQAWQAGDKNAGLLYTDELRLTDARRLLEQEFLDDKLNRDFVRASIAETAERQFAEKLRSAIDVSEMDPKGLVGSNGREKVLRASLCDKSKLVRQNAATFLGRAPVPTLLGQLVELAISDPESRVRRAAAESLVQLRNEQLFDDLLRCLTEAKVDYKRSFEVVGGIARVQIAAEASEQSEDLSPRIAALPWVQRARIWLRIRAVRFVRAIPAFLLILIPQLFLAAISAGTVKALLGMGSYAVAQGDRSIGMGLFHGVVAAFFWGSFITFSIALHRFVFSRRRDRHPLASPVPLRAYFRPAGSLAFGAAGGFVGSCLIVFLIATVFTSSALDTMGWVSTEYPKSAPDYVGNVWRDLLFVTGYLWPYLFTGAALGIGMAMMANGLQASADWWRESRAEEQQLVDLRQILRLFGKTTRCSLSYFWPIPIALTLGWVFAFGTLRTFWSDPAPRPKHSTTYNWHEALGFFRVDPKELQTWGVERAGFLRENKVPVEADAVGRWAKAALFRDKLTKWKVSSWGQGLGIAGDELAQAAGGFFCIVGMGLGLIALARGFNVEPSRDG